MRFRWSMLLLVLSLLAAADPRSGWGAEPFWRSLLPFQRVEADPNASYWLSEANGPWMILAASFAGPQAEQQARELILELRRDFHVPAYLHKRTYDYTKPVRGIGVNPDGSPKIMRYVNAKRFDEYAVLVGDFDSIDSPQLQATLEKLKYARPACLELRRGATAQRFAWLRELQKRIQTDPEKKQRGPMGKAFATRNPLLPAEYFGRRGLDPLVVRMNRNAEYSLLDNPGRYTVRVASFRGVETWNLEEIERIRSGAPMESKLEEAAVKAHRLTTALRRQGYEAYEFHDIHESVVTIGSFDSVGQPRQDGKIELNPAILRIMETFKARRQPLPGGGLAALRPKTLDGIPFDIQPWPVEVPKPFVAAAHADQPRF